MADTRAFEDGLMNLRIKITKWVDERSDSPEIAVLASDDDGVWRLDADSLEQEAVDLQEALFVNPGGAIRIDVERGAPSLERIADALPKTPEYMGWSADWGLETGDDAVDALNDDGGMRVLIDGERWGLFETSGRRWPWDPVDQRVREFKWLRCDPEELSWEHARPLARREIASCSGVETASRIAGYFRWWVLELDDDQVAFCDYLDDDGFSLTLERRAGRSDIEIARALVDKVDGPEVELALRRAIDSGEHFDGVASELDPELSGTCEVRAEVSFLPES
jgi:hypothetical protein